MVRLLFDAFQRHVWNARGWKEGLRLIDRVDMQSTMIPRIVWTS